MPNRTTRCVSQFVQEEKAAPCLSESQHAAIQFSPKPHLSSEYVGCRGSGAVADDLKAPGPTSRYNSWRHTPSF
ncbi:hypothetical protein ACFX13_036486 [Malus domestica]